MKRIKLLFLLIIFSSFAYGETGDDEMLHKGIRWYYKGNRVVERYDIIDSKTMNGKTYGQVRLERGPAGYCDTIGIRYEGGRIYVNKEEYLSLLTEDYYWSLVGEGEPLPYEETADGEVVLYDFTKNAGDVYCQLTDGTLLTVTNVCELKTDDGISRRRLTLSNGLDLIEGVGCTNSPGFLLFWLNIQPSYKENMFSFGILTAFCDMAEDGSLKTLLARDFDAFIKEMNGNPNKMLTQGRRWVYDYDNGEMKGTLTYTIEGDTLLHAYKRAKVYMTLTDKETKKVVRSGYIGAFNEVSNILYYLASDSLEAKPLYDFTIGYRSYFDMNGFSRYVINDDCITVGGDKLHRIQLLNKMFLDALPLDKDSLYYWVEGIGSSKGLLEYNAGTLMDSIQFVGCYDGENCIFTKEDFTKDSGQPLKFNESLQLGALVYRINLEAKTACLEHSDSYQSMDSITIPSTVELWGITCTVDRIGDNVFYGMTNLTSVEIPSTVKTIGESAFRGCTGLETIILPPDLVSIEECVFFCCKSLKSIVFPKNLTTIKGWAFQTCLNLTEIDLPASVTFIGKYAFTHCQSLKDVYCRATALPTTEETWQFRDNSPEATLHVPAASIEAYRKTAPWSGFKNIVPIEDVAYRPMIEDGKVWKVGAVGSGNPVQLVEYYYFDGDTIIDGRTCKQMMCQQYVSPDYPDYDAISQYPSLSYAGAWYEEDKKVYEYNTTEKLFKLLYDFSVEDNATLQIDGQSYVVGPRQTGGLKGFKGVYRDVKRCEDGESSYSPTWLEGVGSLDGPTINAYPGQVDPAWFLMSCSVGDEVIYLNEDYEDGATPMEARKSRFDFVHVIKPKPHAPMMREAEEPIYGEYNEQQLDINLNPLDDAYLVRITNESDKVVYEKAINAGSIVGLNIDISAFPEGHYTVTMENGYESFTGEFGTQTTGIAEVRSKRSEVRSAIYNLQGQRISSLQKGLNIVNGQKLFIK